MIFELAMFFILITWVLYLWTKVQKETEEQ
jgi:hypothetical protein